MAASYFMGMISTLSSAHTLLTNLHQQLNAVASEKARLNKEAQILGVLQEVKSGHWTSPVAWAILAPEALWLGFGLIIGIGVTIVIFKRRRTVQTLPFTKTDTNTMASEASWADAPLNRDTPRPDLTPPPAAPSRQTDTGWLREFIGLVTWVVVVAGLAFIIVHTGITWSHSVTHLSNLSHWL